MEVFQMPTKPSWTQILSDMNIDDKLKVTLSVGRGTVAPRISREIKLKYPEREYITDSKSEPKYLIIKRVA